MTKKLSIIVTLFISSFCLAQQTKTTNTLNKPLSIYTSSINFVNQFSYTSVKKKLNFKKNYSFTTVSFEDIDSGLFLISDNNLSTKSTKFIYDDYKSYRDENLLKGFLQKYDLTRWNVCNFRQPNLN